MAWLASWACDCCHLVSRVARILFKAFKFGPQSVTAMVPEGAWLPLLLEGDYESETVVIDLLLWVTKFAWPECLHLQDDVKMSSQGLNSCVCWMTSKTSLRLTCWSSWGAMMMEGMTFQSGGEDGGPITSKLLVNPPLTFISTALSTLSPPSGGGSPTPAMLSCAFSPKEALLRWPEHMSSPGWTGHKWTHEVVVWKAFVRKPAAWGCF